jgi:transcription initiation factor TFIIE subunit alpha
MKITKEIEEEVISQVSGSDVLPLVDYLRGKKDVSEFIIAKDMDEEIQLIRNQLYRLLDFNLITFWRKKDKQKGWYIYYWTYNQPHIEFLFWDLKKKKLEKFTERLHRETTEFFFMCQDNGCVRLDFEKATEFNYQCPECGGMMTQQDNTRTVEFLTTNIAELEKDLKKVGKLS